MKVKEVMTASKLRYCSPETNLRIAAQTMKDGNCGALPVINKEQKVVGLITDRDIALSLTKRTIQSASKLEVKNIMSLNVRTIKTNDNINDALKIMRISQVGRLPVVDGKGKLKGIVSLHNLLSKAGSKNGLADLGSLTVPGENLMKTIQALNNRYVNNQLSKVEKVK